MNKSQLKKIIQVLSPSKGLSLLKEFENTIDISSLKKYIENEKIRLTNMSIYENKLYDEGFKYIGGIDEVGRGPLAGPVVTACVILPKGYQLCSINDSKKVSESKRIALYEQIKSDSISFHISEISHKEIDQINILQATKKAMTDSFNNLGIKADVLLIDAMNLPSVSIRQQSIIKGDEKSISIACASIIAKVYRDNIMIKAHELYPQYQFHKNKGYGTKEHIEAIKKYGLCEIHRRTFTKNIV